MMAVVSADTVYLNELTTFRKLLFGDFLEDNGIIGGITPIKAFNILADGDTTFPYAVLIDNRDSTLIT
jgi:hypothetical protein